MNEIKDCIDALLAAVQNSEEYQEFEKYRDLLKKNPELMDRVNTFRGNNFRLQKQTEMSCSGKRNSSTENPGSCAEIPL